MTKYYPLGGMVLCKMVRADLVRGMLMPDVAQEGKIYIVQEIGPDVKQVQIGDKVLIMGTRKVDWDFLPGSNDLFIVPEKCILLKYEEVPEGGEE